MRSTTALLVLSLLLGCGGAEPAPAPTTPIVAARPADQGAVSQLSARWPDGSSRSCHVDWTSPGTTWHYDGTLTMMRQGAQVVGSIDWRLVASDSSIPELAARIGDRAGERIEGALDPTTGAFLLHTSWIGDPTLIGAASYRLELTDGGFFGATASADDGTWDGVFRCGTAP